MKKLLSLAIIASMALVSCSKEENPTTIDSKQDKEIKLTAGISASTKTAYNPASAVSSVQFLRVNDANGAVAPEFSSVTTPIVGSIAATTGAITFTSTQYYDKDADQYAWFAGYYPALDKDATWTIDGKKDIMTTAAPVTVGKYSEPVADATMAFEHRLAQLFVKCEAAEGVSASVANAAWGAITNIEVVGAKNTATYDKGAAAVTFGTTTADIPLLQAADLETAFVSATIDENGSGNAVAGAMLAPGSTSINLKITTAKGGEKILNGITLSSFAASTKNTITLYFGAVDVKIGTKATIGAWENGGTGSGEVK